MDGTRVLVGLNRLAKPYLSPQPRDGTRVLVGLNRSAKSHLSPQPRGWDKSIGRPEQISEALLIAPASGMGQEYW